MKHVLLLLATFLSVSAFSQNWATFPLDSSAQWQIDYAWLDGEGCLFEHEVIYFLEGEVSIDSTAYQQIGFYGYRWVENTFSGGCQEPPMYFDGTVGLFRTEDGKYYRHNLGEDELMFDFSLGIGDTLFSALSVFDPLVIQSVDSIEIDGVFRKRQWLNQDLWVIEGIGSAYGFDQSLYQFENWSSLNCYSHSGVPQLGLGTYCRLINGLEINEVLKANVSPNPSSGIFNLTVQQQFSYQVYDLFGRLIQTGAGSTNAEIDLRYEPDGVYLLRLESKKGSLTQKLVKQ
ncbi:MAG: T9SS type A sorting domain-containing protein [Flavobacteriales bacterium]|nr:T9SS type A sorting domain-containing protein [Flavobacteriales bacterium]